MSITPDHHFPTEKDKAKCNNQSKLNFQKKPGSLTEIDKTSSDSRKCAGEKHDDSNTATNAKSSASINDKHEITVGLKNSSYDIGSFYEDVSKLSDNEKYSIIKKV